jgi:hypothetical protein
MGATKLPELRPCNGAKALLERRLLAASRPTAIASA